MDNDEKRGAEPSGGRIEGPVRPVAQGLEHLGDRVAVLTSLIHEPLEALGRLLGRRKRYVTIGLALSGGAARGIAHIGVLDVLLRAGIVPDLVAGTSAGAAVGALFCRGWSPEQMLRLARGLSLLKLGRPGLRRPGLLDSERIESLVVKLVGDLTFADLSIPLAVVACDLLSGEKVVLREGPLALAVRASCSIPGVFTPVEASGQLLIDGGVVDALPIAVVQEMGADYVIAIDLHPAEVNSARPTSFVDVLLASFQIMRHYSEIYRSERADCLIRPDVSCFDWLRFGSQADDLFRAGREAAEAALPCLQEGLERGR